MNAKIYDIDYSKMVKWLTPPKMQGVDFLKFAGYLVVPVVWIYQSFKLFRSAKLYQLMITPQKCYLERLLNDRYDFTLRRIYIDDGIDKLPFYIFKDAELKPKYIYLNSEATPKYIYTSGESGSMADDFIIFVPLGLVFEEPEMISLVKAYKLAGTKFKIQRF